MMPALPAVAVEEAVNDPLTVRGFPVFGDHGGYGRTACRGRCSLARECRTHRQARRKGTQDLPPRPVLAIRRSVLSITGHEEPHFRVTTIQQM